MAVRVGLHLLPHGRQRRPQALMGSHGRHRMNKPTTNPVTGDRIVSTAATDAYRIAEVEHRKLLPSGHLGVTLHGYRETLNICKGKCISPFCPLRSDLIKCSTVIHASTPDPYGIIGFYEATLHQRRTLISSSRSNASRSARPPVARGRSPSCAVLLDAQARRMAVLCLRLRLRLMWALAAVDGLSQTIWPRPHARAVRCFQLIC